MRWVCIKLKLHLGTDDEFKAGTKLPKECEKYKAPEE